MTRQCKPKERVATAALFFYCAFLCIGNHLYCATIYFIEAFKQTARREREVLIKEHADVVSGKYMAFLVKNGFAKNGCPVTMKDLDDIIAL